MTGGPFIVHVTDSSDIQVYGMKDGTVCTNPELIGRSWFCHVFCLHNPELIGRSWFCHVFCLHNPELIGRSWFCYL